MLRMLKKFTNGKIFVYFFPFSSYVCQHVIFSSTAENKNDVQSLGGLSTQRYNIDNNSVAGRCTQIGEMIS